MFIYMIRRAPETADDGLSSSSDIVTISRAELETLRSQAALSATAAAEGRAAAETFAPGASDETSFSQVTEPGQHGSEWSDPDGQPSLRREREDAIARELATHQKKAERLERALTSALRDRELATALAGKPLVPGALPQLLKLWRDDFDVIDESGEYQVFARDGRSVEEVLGERLADPAYAHFCQPSSKGGTIVPGANRPASGKTAVASPRNLGEEAVQRWQEALSHGAQRAPEPVGLGRRRKLF